ncbi:MAG: tetratricopeptide repeat protein [Myxococcota bacterium]
MTNPDPSEFHLEGLRDAELRGECHGADLERLHAHVATCPACQLERQIARDAVDGSDARWDAVFAAVEGELDSAPQVRVRPRFRARAAGVLALVIAGASGGVAAAATLPWVQAWVDATLDDGEEEVVGPEPEPVQAIPRPEVEEAPVDEEAVPEVEPPTEEVAPAPTPPPLTERELFERANRARRNGDRGRAVRLYRQLVQRFPRSNRAATARVTLGRLLLEQGSSAAALSQFDAYLRGRSGGALAEQALVGRARALRRLGRSSAERAAWERLLRSYPNSLHAPEAQRRLER